nr:MAG TPA: hypothetical protein [Bacteriophage sp.]
MQEIQNLAQINYVLVILGLFAILFAAKEILEIFGYFKKKFRLKTGIDEDRETVENRIKTLEKHDNWQYQEIQKISRGIDDIKDNLVQKEISDIRWELLNFCSALTGGQDYNREAFEHIFRTYEDYEKILTENHMSNGYIVESMKVVREIYHNKLVNGDFK